MPKENPSQQTKKNGDLTSANWLDICRLEDLTPLYGSCAQVHGHQVAIFLLADGQELYAIDNYDPIGKANVLSRGIVGDINGEVVVASPLYKQHFNLKTGQCLENKDIRVDTYEIRVKDGSVQIGI